MKGSAYTEKIVKALSGLYRNEALTELTEFLRGELRILEYIDSNGGGMPPGEIASALYMSGPRVAAALGALERKELVIRVPDTRDRRRVLVSLTESGKDYIGERRDSAFAFVQNTLDDLGEHDASELTRILTKLDKTL